MRRILVLSIRGCKTPKWEPMAEFIPACNSLLPFVHLAARGQLCRWRESHYVKRHSWRVLDAVPTISALDGHECDNREAIVRHLKVVGRTPDTGDWSLKETWW